MKRTHRACYHALHSMNPAGVYIHIPFCKSRCSYCDFATGIYQSELAERYVQALLKDIRTTRHRELPGLVDTIYFGGGTPSMLTPKQIATILETVNQSFEVDKDAEVTMEINPGSVTESILKDFKIAGVNRASFGAQ